MATILFTQWGYFWYAMLLDDVWQSLIGKTELELIQLAEQRGPIQSFYTYGISLVQVLGLSFLMPKLNAKSFWDYQVLGLAISTFLVIPALGNAVLFAGQSFQLWLMDSMHFWLGYALIAFILKLGSLDIVSLASYSRPQD